jgi:hypothetical protein
MVDRINPNGPRRPPRAGLLVLAAVASGALVAGCGAGSPGRTATRVSRPAIRSTAGSTRPTTTAGPSTGAGASTTSAGSTTAGGHPGALAYARCMRANGVASFPDPQPGGGFAFHASAEVISSPAFKAAQAKCSSLLGGPLGAGAQTVSPQVQAHALSQLRKVAQCMRQHGISDFPDPSTTRPTNLGLGQYSEITDYQGAWLLFPATIDMQSPAWERAAAACGALAESLNHPHH